jgi:hypothetical protein
MALDETRDEYYYLLAEGCCPFRCGPLKRRGITTAVCECCGLEWASPGIPEIFPSNTVPKPESGDKT